MHATLMHSANDMILSSDLKDFRIQCLGILFRNCVTDYAVSDGRDYEKPNVQIRLRIPESIPYDEYSGCDSWILL